MVLLANTQKVASTDTQPPKQKGHSPAEESTDHSADANISDRDPKVGASVKETREGRPGKDGKIHIACVEMTSILRKHVQANKCFRVAIMRTVSWPGTVHQRAHLELGSTSVRPSTTMLLTPTH